MPNIAMVPPNDFEKRRRIRRALATEANAWLARAWRMKALLATRAKVFQRTGVRTDADAELTSLAWYRLHEAIYNLNLLKQMLIGL